jgi:hypothetical protein
MSGVLNEKAGDDPRPRYDVLQPLAPTEGDFRWMKIGTAYLNPDGTLDGYLDQVLVGRRFRLCEARPYGTPNGAASAPEKGAGHGG